MVDSVCKNFEDYAQAKTKTRGDPVIIRLVTLLMLCPPEVYGRYVLVSAVDPDLE